MGLQWYHMIGEALNIELKSKKHKNDGIKIGLRKTKIVKRMKQI